MNAEMAETEEKKEEKKTETKTDEIKAENPAEAKTQEPSESKVDDKKKAEPSSAAVNNLRVLENIEVRLTVEVGNTEIKIKDLLRLNEGSVVELDRLAGEPLDILANGTKIAKGEVVMVGERFGIRFTEVADPEEMVQNL
ncbi:MAG: Flagellar motor switch protein FliN [Alphaproteobacteria bacterium MarineAlpha8_Bin1]|nr:MAG: Flagellar motor switch protein FliN [Alphaproteobacteria bacterium MarineAlpha8_Bin1]|tara:strand:- start:1011 stop:1430 length:420 start_codon:yes stop_codon:yes gene_type:complete